jgi:hypothetical protein
VAKYRRVRSSGHVFVFKYDDTNPPILHIWVRHLTTPGDAVATFFEGKTVWNDAHRRFESYTPSHGLYWYWRDEAEKVVMVITCFRR